MEVNEEMINKETRGETSTYLLEIYRKLLYFANKRTVRTTLGNFHICKSVDKKDAK